MSFSYDRAWSEMQALWRAHGEYVAILAGLFVMVPNFVRNLFFPMPPIAAFDAESIAVVRAYLIGNFWPLLLINLTVLLGSSSILGTMLDTRRPTVGEAIKVAFVMSPSIFAMNLLAQLAVLGGLFLLVVPGVYLMGRLAVAASWQMAHRSMNPIAALGHSFDLTRGNGWSIAGLLLIFFIVAWIATGAIGAVLGILLSVVIPASSLAAVAGFLSAILGTLAILAMLMLGAAIYRQLAPQA